MPDASLSVLLTCEHATHSVPREFRGLFKGADEVLASHRGWDPGALEMAEALSRIGGVRLMAGEATRLLVELNRSLENPELWSEFTAGLSEIEKAEILRRHYVPFRSRVHHQIGREIGMGGRVLHFSVHSFTPVFRGMQREVDVGLLFDTGKALEVAVCESLGRTLRSGLPDLRVRMNEPYLGVDDGFTTWLRRHYPAERYAGIELEFNQALPARGETWNALAEVIGDRIEDWTTYGFGSGGGKLVGRAI